MAQITHGETTEELRRFHRGEGLDFTVDDGEFFCLLGPSGCGKTTTLRMIAGLELPTIGRNSSRWRGRARSSAPRSGISPFVFQLFALYPHMNVRRNISLPAAQQRLPKAEIKSKRRGGRAYPAHRASARQSCLGTLGRRPAAGCAWPCDRARPKAFMMDEPLGALDAEFRHVMCGELRALHDRIEGDHGLRDARPARSDGDGRHDRRYESRRY